MQEKEVEIPDSTCIRKKAIFLQRVQAGNGKKGTEVRILIALFPPCQVTCVWLPQMKVTALSRPLSFVVPIAAASSCPFRSRDSNSCTSTNLSSFHTFFGSPPFSPQLGIESHWKETLGLNVVWMCHLFPVETQTRVAFQIMLWSKSPVMPPFVKQPMLFDNSACTLRAATKWKAFPLFPPGNSYLSFLTSQGSSFDPTRELGASSVTLFRHLPLWEHMTLYTHEQ